MPPLLAGGFIGSPNYRFFELEKYCHAKADLRENDFRGARSLMRLPQQANFPQFPAGAKVGRYGASPSVVASNVPPGAPASWLTKVALVLFGLYYTAIVTYDGRIGAFYLGEEKGFLLTRSFYILGFLSVCLSFVRGRWRGPVGASLLFGFFIFLMFQFSSVSSDELGLIPLYGRLGIFIIPLVVLLYEDRQYLSIEKIVYHISALYAAWYLVTTVGLLLGFVHPDDSGLFRSSVNDARGNRLAINDAVISILFFLAMLRPGKRGIYNWFVIIVCLADLYLCKSRVYQASLIFELVVLAIFRSSLKASLSAMVLFLAVSTFLVFSMGRSGNPFEIFGDDTSAAARAVSYEIAKPIISTHWFSGVGLATTELGDRSVTLVNRFFWNDLGPIGVLYIGGLLGLAIFAAMSTCCFLGFFLIKRYGAPPWFANAFGLAATLTALNGVIAPTLFFYGLTVFAFAFAAVLAKSPDMERPVSRRVAGRTRRPLNISIGADKLDASGDVSPGQSSRAAQSTDV